MYLPIVLFGRQTRYPLANVRCACFEKHYHNIALHTLLSFESCFKVRSGSGDLYILESARYVLMEASMVIITIANGHVLMFFTGAARRKKRLKSAARQRAAAGATSSIGYVNESTASA